MTLPCATLFPQALLPLYIFEPRYRRMLADTLAGHRMFVVAMQRPGCIRELPASVAGLGLIRACVSNRDGTSHLILQGITRVELVGASRYKPYRVDRLRPLQSSPRDSVRIDALLAKVRDLVVERLQLGASLPVPPETSGKSKRPPPALPVKEMVAYLDRMSDPEQVADLVSCALLPEAEERQSILETVDLEPRLRCLIRFLLAEIDRRRNEPKTHP